MQKIHENNLSEKPTVYIPKCTVTVFACSEQLYDLCSSIEGNIALEQVNLRIKYGTLNDAIAYFTTETATNIVIAEMTDDKEDLPTFAEVLPPETELILFGESNDIELYKELKDLGVFEYVAKQLTTSEFLKLLQNAASIISSGKEGQICTFVPMGHGSGNSTIAQNFALKLCNETQLKVLLMDLDFSFGTSSLTFGVDSTNSFAELTTRRTVKSFDVQQCCVAINENFDLLANDSDLSFFLDEHLEKLTEILSIVRELYDYVIIDLPTGWHKLHSHVINRSDKHVVVASSEISSFRDIGNFFVFFDKYFSSAFSFQLVINKVRSNEVERLFLRELKNISADSKPILIPEQNSVFQKALEIDRPVVESVSKSTFAKQIKLLISKTFPEIRPIDDMNLIAKLLRR